MRIYIAGLFEDRPRLRTIRVRLQAAGHQVTSSWLDEPDDVMSERPGTWDDTAAGIARRDLSEIAQSDLLAVDTFGTGTRGGREVELGYAMGIGKQAVIVGPARNVFHALVPRYDGWHEVELALAQGTITAPSRPTPHEVRLVDPSTGAQKGGKLARFDLLPPAAMELMEPDPPELLLAEWWCRVAGDRALAEAADRAMALLGARGLEWVASVYGWGATKYAERNWELGYPWSWSYAAAQRHAAAARRGEWLDPESGLPHWAHFVWHCLALMTWCETHPEKDDRPKA
jgi:hypothetical protein